MNPAVIVTHNCLELTKRCVRSIQEQDGLCKPFFVDNGSTDGTREWIKDHTCRFINYSFNAGVSVAWNDGLHRLFNREHFESVIVVNNDTKLPKWFVKNLLSYKVPFVTGVSCDRVIEQEPEPSNLVPHPDFSAFLIRRSAWEAIGPFDEGMKFYAQDCDYHVRACQAGVPLLAANAPFYHERSSTLKNASPEEAAEIQRQADLDRAYFYKKWGFAVGSEEYQRATQTVAGTPVPFPGEVR